MQSTHNSEINTAQGGPWLKLLASLSIGLPLVAQPPAATASPLGLAGPFASDLWQLEVMIQDEESQTFSDPDYLCTDEFDLSCVDLTGPSSFLVVGSGEGDLGPLNKTVSVDWKLTYSGALPALISFDWEFFTQDEPNRDFGYFQIDGTNEFESSQESGPFSYESPLIQPGTVLTFGVRSTDNNLDVGELTITNFHYTEVPGPLPLLGAATAFGWSRRLRTRIRNQHIRNQQGKRLP